MGAAAERADDEAITYSKYVSRILQKNCQVCHQPGSIGPMSLTSYEEVRPWAPLIKEQVVAQNMPPFHRDTDVGIQEIKNSTMKPRSRASRRHALT